MIVTAAMAIALTAHLSGQTLRRTVRELWLSVALQRAHFVANDTVLPARLSQPHGGAATAIAVTMHRIGQQSLLSTARTLHLIAKEHHGDTAARAIGTAQFLSGNYAEAVTAFSAIGVPRADDWNDRAAALIGAANLSNRPDYWLEALAAVDRALDLDSWMIEARFNRAVILDAMGVTSRTRVDWKRYLVLDPSSPWAAIANARLREHSPADTSSWRTATQSLDNLSPESLTRLVKLYPQAARRYADAIYLAEWAQESVAGNDAAAEKQLQHLRTIADALLIRNGEGTLADVVMAIERATGTPQLPILRAGHLAYAAGRIAYRDSRLADAERELRRATRLFAMTGSAMSSMASFYLACVFAEQNRLADAETLLRSVLRREAAFGTRHSAAIAHVEYQLGLLEAVAGHWSASLALAASARARFASLGEHGNVANADALLAENYDLLGHSPLAWQHGFAALRGSSAEGDMPRVRVGLAALSRTELRSGRWARARSLILLEAELPAGTDLRLEPDRFVRLASAEWHLENSAGAHRALEGSRTTAAKVPDPRLRGSFIATADAAEATFLRAREPRRAIALLSSSISFQRSGDRPIFLPELYLERGRAHLAVEGLDDAERDFEAGLQELERQRTSVSEAELRPGIFDDASELFDEAISVQLRRRASPDAVLRLVERGRARAVLEQINASEDDFPAPELPRIADIQAALPPATALLEYVSLPDRLLAFVITRELAVLRTIHRSRAELTRAADAFAEGRGASGGVLYEMLLAPLRDHLHGVAAINIVADDFLQRLPFAAFFDRSSGTFLVQRYVIATSPSAGVFLKALDRTQRLPEARVARALIFANPAIPRDQFGELPSLAAAESEAPRVARYYRDGAEVFTGESATAERFYALAPSSEYVSFAGHGVVREREPYASALVCAATPAVPGGVTVREIARMKFRKTRAVVLAACSTMTGRNAAVEGVPSLARAFVVAGVPAVVGTLWDIEDSEAAAITRPLHQQLARGVPPAEALRAAQLAAIERGLPPSRWSAFAVMGSAAAGEEAAQGVGDRASKATTPRKPDA